MKRNTTKTFLSWTARTRRASASVLYVVMTATLALGTLSPAFGDSQTKGTKSALTEDQKITHLLNRLGFAPRPGDVERARAMGLDKFTDQQLHAARLVAAA